MDDGFHITLWLLLTKPGGSIRKYVLGKRKAFANPIQAFIIVGAVATYLTLEYKFFLDIEKPTMDLYLYQWRDYYFYSSKYFTFFNLTAIPFFALFTWMFFRKSGFSYLENLIMNLYVVTGQLIILVLLTPLFLFSDKEIALFVYGIINIGYNIWAVVFFFKSFSPTGIFKVLLAVLIPQLTVYFFNYGVFQIAPSSFWKFLDVVFGSILLNFEF